MALGYIWNLALASDTFGQGCDFGVDGPPLERELAGVLMYAIIFESLTNLKKSYNCLGHARGCMQ